MAKNKRGSAARRKGHDLERKIVRDLIKIGYSSAKTSRACSKLLDDCQVDIATEGALIEQTSMLIQAKAGYHRARPKADLIFNEMDRRLAEQFPSEHKILKKPKYLVHKLGNKKNEQLVTMTYNTWLNLISEVTDLRTVDVAIRQSTEN
jgi:hypothetical protein